jgi:hypothetical protein
MDPILVVGFVSMAASALTVVIVNYLKKRGRSRGPDEPRGQVTIDF